MKKIMIALSLSACSSTSTILVKPQNASQLMRESYLIGCGEEALRHAPKPLVENQNQVLTIINECEVRAQMFNPNQSPSYNRTEE